MNAQASKAYLDQKLKELITELPHEELVEKYIELLKKWKTEKVMKYEH